MRLKFYQCFLIGCDHLLHTATGSLIATSSSQVLLNQLQSQHPVATVLIQTLKARQSIHSDGTASFVLQLCGALNELESMLSNPTSSSASEGLASDLSIVSRPITVTSSRTLSSISQQQHREIHSQRVRTRLAVLVRVLLQWRFEQRLTHWLHNSVLPSAFYTPRVNSDPLVTLRFLFETMLNGKQSWPSIQALSQIVCQWLTSISPPLLIASTNSPTPCQTSFVGNTPPKESSASSSINRATNTGLQSSTTSLRAAVLYANEYCSMLCVALAGGTYRQSQILPGWLLPMRFASTSSRIQRVLRVDRVCLLCLSDDLYGSGLASSGFAAASTESQQSAFLSQPMQMVSKLVSLCALAGINMLVCCSMLSDCTIDICSDSGIICVQNVDCAVLDLLCSQTGCRVVESHFVRSVLQSGHVCYIYCNVQSDGLVAVFGHALSMQQLVVDQTALMHLQPLLRHSPPTALGESPVCLPHTLLLRGSSLVQAQQQQTAVMRILKVALEWHDMLQGSPVVSACGVVELGWYFDLTGNPSSLCSSKEYNAGETDACCVLGAMAMAVPRQLYCNATSTAKTDSLAKVWLVFLFLVQSRGGFQKVLHYCRQQRALIKDDTSATPFATVIHDNPDLLPSSVSLGLVCHDPLRILRGSSVGGTLYDPCNASNPFARMSAHSSALFSLSEPRLSGHVELLIPRIESMLGVVDLLLQLLRCDAIIRVPRFRKLCMNDMEKANDEVGELDEDL